jgi:hypothetical protein
VQFSDSSYSQDYESESSDCYLDYEKSWGKQQLLAESTREVSGSNKKLENASEASLEPADSVPLRKFSISDFNFLKVLGRGSFGKVRDSCHESFFLEVYFLAPHGCGHAQVAYQQLMVKTWF